MKYKIDISISWKGIVVFGYFSISSPALPLPERSCNQRLISSYSHWLNQADSVNLQYHETNVVRISRLLLGTNRSYGRFLSDSFNLTDSLRRTDSFRSRFEKSRILKQNKWFSLIQIQYFFTQTIRKLILNNIWTYMIWIRMFIVEPS